MLMRRRENSRISHHCRRGGSRHSPEESRISDIAVEELGGGDEGGFRDVGLGKRGEDAVYVGEIRVGVREEDVECELCQAAL